MPIHSRASIRYARALLMAAERSSEVETLTGEVKGMRELVSRSPELRAFLEDPSLSVRNKLETLERLFAERVSPLLMRFLRLLVEKYRERILPEILTAAEALIDEREGRVRADVRSAVMLDSAQTERLREQLARATGKKVIMEVRQDASLGAGFVARVGDTIYDASLAAQLRRLRRRLAETDVRAAKQA